MASAPRGRTWQSSSCGAVAPADGSSSHARWPSMLFRWPYCLPSHPRGLRHHPIHTVPHGSWRGQCTPTPGLAPAPVLPPRCTHPSPTPRAPRGPPGLAAPSTTSDARPCPVPGTAPPAEEMEPGTMQTGRALLPALARHRDSQVLMPGKLRG